MRGCSLATVGSKTVLLSSSKELSHRTCDVTCKNNGDAVFKNAVNCSVHTSDNHVHGSTNGQFRPIQFHSRCFYNKKYRPRDIESLLVRPCHQAVRAFKSQNNTKRSYASAVKQSIGKHCRDALLGKQQTDIVAKKTVGAESRSVFLLKSREYNPDTIVSNTVAVQSTECIKKPQGDNLSPSSIEKEGRELKSQSCVHSEKPRLKKVSTVNLRHNTTDTVSGHSAACVSNPQGENESGNHVGKHEQVRVFDVSTAGHDKFLHAVLYQNNNSIKHNSDCEVFKQCKNQSKYDFGFVPLTNPIMPTVNTFTCSNGNPIGDLHREVKRHGCYNYLGARISLDSQLNVDKWREYLCEYWDKQLLEFIQFGFPMGFNRECPLRHDAENHSSATDYPSDIQAYLDEEVAFGAIIGPFKSNPISNGHTSPFMSRPKPNSDVRRVIVDLSWPKGMSVNDGVDKHGYMGSDFSLTFPSIDHLTTELAKLGPGAHIYKIDISRAFRHLKMDPFDYDLLGLNWNGVYVDTCLPFGARHGSQFFQRVSDAVRHVMRCRGFDVINYIDDFLGFGTPIVAQASYDTLRNVMGELGLTISQKKLVPPATKAVCLGVLIDTEAGTISIPDDKLRSVRDMVNAWAVKTHCTKRQLQSLLGSLLYVHKCVKPGRCFLNRMLEVLRQAPDQKRIVLTPEFKRDIRWFQKFLPLYNGVSMFAHKNTDFVLELDACLTGLGGRWGAFVYHLPLPVGFRGLDIVHLEMINIFLAVKLFSKAWKHRRVLIKCDNMAVVSVLKSGRARDPYHGACARNVWYVSALCDIDLQYLHVLGKQNRAADLLSRWTNSAKDGVELSELVGDPVWIPVSTDLLDLDNTL